MQEPLGWDRLSAYVHFPYCRNICDFCNYETRLITRTGVDQFRTDVAGEIARYGERDDFRTAAVSSLFFGGGTASLMPLDTLEATVAAVRHLTGQSTISEVTLECEPGTITRQALARARESGVNRVGVCAQAFDDELLRRLTRKHNRGDALRLIDDAMAVGIDNLHVDLMYGIPGQSLADWRRTVEFTARLPISHVSAYKFYVFKNGAVDRAGAAPRPDEEPLQTTARLRDMHDMAVELFSEHGLEQYTLTEFARPGAQCDYLLNTFGGRDVLPLGPSAFGRCRDRVWRNPGLVSWYRDASTWDAERRGVVLDQSERFKRDFVLGLWLLQVDVTQAAGPTAQPSAQLDALLDQLAADDLLERHATRVQLAAHQRFGAGTTMRRLAELDATAWTSTPKPSPPPGDIKASGSALSSEMLSLLRVLRSDPLFVTDLQNTPDAAVAKVEKRLPDEEREALLTVAKGDAPADTPVGHAIGQAWQAISLEHRRVPRPRRGERPSR